MDLLPIERFAGAANQTFDLAIGEASMALTLVDVKPLPATRGAPGMMRQPFSLLFRSASPVVLPQRIYWMQNATMGKLGIFIVPLGRDQAGVTYQAIFN
jgi:hypothetical protein